MDTTITNKAPTVSLMAMASLFMTAIVDRVRATIEAQAPVGYEDEAGFHFGEPDFKN